MNNQYRVDAVFSANPTNFISGIRSMIGSMKNLKNAANAKDFNREWQQTGAQFESMGARMVTSGAKIAAASGAAFTAVALGYGKMVGAAAEYESALTGVAKTTDMSSRELRDMDLRLREMARSIPLSYKELATLAETAGQFGVPKEQIADFTQAVAELGATTNMTAETAAQEIAQFSNIFGVESDKLAKNARDVGNALVELGNNSATTEADIMHMAARIAAAGQQVGMSQSDVLALSAAMSSLGIEAEAGGTAVSMTLQQMNTDLAAGGAAAQAWADVAGMSVDQFKTAFETDAYGALTKVLEGLNEVHASGGDVSATLEKLGITGIRQKDVMSRLSNATDTLSQYQRMANTEFESGNALSKEAEMRNKTFDSQLKMFLNTLKNIAANLGGPIKSALSDLIAGITPAVQKFEAFTDSLYDADGALTETGKKVGQLALAVPKVLALATAFGVLKSGAGLAFQALGKGMQAVPGLINSFQTYDGVVLKLGTGLKNSFSSMALGISSFAKTSAVSMGASTASMSKFRAGVVSATGGLGKFVAGLNPLTVGIVAVTAVIAGAVMAWKSNFNNIQGFAKKAFGGIVDSLRSMGSAFGAIKSAIAPVASLIGNFLKSLGTGAIVAFTFALAAAVDIIRIVVGAVGGLVSAFAGITSAVSAFTKVITGDLDGAKESLNNAKTHMENAGKSFADAFNPANSAILKTKDALGALGQETDVAGGKTTSFAADAVRATASIERMGSAADVAKSAIDNMLSGVESGSKLAESLNAQKNLITKAQQDIESSTEQHKERLSEIDKMSGEERLTALEKENKRHADIVLKAGDDLRAAYQSNGELLRNQVDADGVALTETQISNLQAQREAMRVQLEETNFAYLESLKSRLEAGAEIEQADFERGLAALNENYQMRQEAILENETQMEEIRQKLAEETDAAKKADYENQLQALEDHNTALRAKNVTFGEEMLALLQTQGEANYETYSAALARLGVVTDEQLGQMLSSYVQAGGEVDGVMMLLAQQLGARGHEGSTNLINAIKAGDYTGAAQYVDDEVIKTLQSLPPGLFKNGDEGQSKFIEAIKSGDFAGAGQYMADQTDTGLSTVKEKAKTTGEEAMAQYEGAVERGAPGAKGAAESVGDSTKAGVDSKTDEIKTVGDKQGDQYVKAINSRTGQSRNAGMAIANAAKSGAMSVGGWHNVGYNFVAGMASGVYSGSGILSGAVRSVVYNAIAAARAAAAVASPSRKFRDLVGVYFPSGIAEGVLKNAHTAYDAITEVVDEMQSRFNPEFELPDIQGSLRAINGDLGDLQVSHLFGRDKTDKEPVTLVLNVAGRTLRAITDDITKAQGQALQLTEVFGI